GLSVSEWPRGAELKKNPLFEKEGVLQQSEGACGLLVVFAVLWWPAARVARNAVSAGSVTDFK
ncbi:hypothetical protein ACW5W8_21700, partial [Aeromonas aquatilis]